MKEKNTRSKKFGFTLRFDKGDSDYLRFKESTSQYIKWLSNIEFLLSIFEFERQNIAGCCKQTFCFQFNIKLIQSKT